MTPQSPDASPASPPAAHPKHGDSAVAFPTPTRVHIGLEVTALDPSIDFYRALLRTEPSKRRTGYAKFEPLDPPVNLSLIERKATDGVAPKPLHPPGATHYGVQVKTIDEVKLRASQLERQGHAVRLEDTTLCCYAVQTKAWVDDPDGRPWEIFVVIDADADRMKDEDPLESVKRSSSDPAPSSPPEPPACCA